MKRAGRADSVALEQHTAVLELRVQAAEILGIEHIRIRVQDVHQQFAIAQEQARQGLQNSSPAE